MHSFAGVSIFSLHLRPSILQPTCHATWQVLLRLRLKIGWAWQRGHCEFWLAHTPGNGVESFGILFYTAVIFVISAIACVQRHGHIGTAVHPEDPTKICREIWRWKSFGDALTLLVRWQEGHPTWRQQFPNVLHWKTYSGSGPAGSDIISRK